ncbi:hypothetical protein ISR94_00330 [Candidatus Microgenomates bacterium]|nr:hypothetical protein [Candidatus Microgenomates bacterium]
MLTKVDLKKLREIIREEVGTDNENIKTEIGGDITMAGMRVANELREVKSRLKNIEIVTKKIQKYLKIVSNTLDKEDIKTLKKVRRIETHLHLPEIEFA